MSWLTSLQGLDHPTKTKVMVVVTAVLMVIVIYFWLVYFNDIAGIAPQSLSTLPAGQNGPGSQGASPAASTGAGTNAGVGTWQTIQSQFGALVQGLKNLVQSPRQYIVSPSQPQ